MKMVKSPKQKRTNLHNWQKPISKEEYIKKVETGSRVVGFFAPTNQYYETDITHPLWKEKQDAKAEKKQARKQKVTERINKYRDVIKDLKTTIKEKEREIKKLSSRTAEKKAEAIAKVATAEARLEERKKKLGIF